MSYQNTNVRTCCSGEMEQTSRLGVKRGCWQLQRLGSRTENRITGLRGEPGEFQEGLSENLDDYLDISPWLDTVCAGRGKWAHSRLAKPSLSTCFWHCPSQVGICTTGHGGIGRQPLRGAFRADMLHYSCCIGPKKNKIFSSDICHTRYLYSEMGPTTQQLFVLAANPHRNNTICIWHTAPGVLGSSPRESIPSVHDREALRDRPCPAP